MAVTGIFGCSSVERLDHRVPRSWASFAPFKPRGDQAPEAASAAAPGTPTPALSATPPIQAGDPPAPALDIPAHPPMPAPEPLPPSRQPIELAARPVPSAKPALSRGLSPRQFRADNRLLELLERDLDRAVEQPAEHRRLQFSQDVVNHPEVRHFIRYYSGAGKNRFQTLLARSGKYMPMIAKVLNQEGLPEELGYLALLESEFVVTTTSRNGAVGLWQFIASTARRYNLRIDEWIDERRDPVKSTRAAAAYLKDLHDRFGRWHLVTAAYNAGPAAIDKALQQSGAKDFWSIKTKAQLSDETRKFVPKFVAIALIAMEPKKYGFDEIAYQASLDYEEVEVSGPTSLAALAALTETDLSVIKDLNPALLRSSTPPGEASFRVNLPVGKASVFLAKMNEKRPEKDAEPTRVVTHEVKRGETLFSIARFYGLHVRALMEFNGLSTTRIRIGQKLRIWLGGLRGALR
jgi:membrane-bound lytic murein transglycosylase D